MQKPAQKTHKSETAQPSLVSHRHHEGGNNGQNQRFDTEALTTAFRNPQALGRLDAVIDRLRSRGNGRHPASSAVENPDVTA